MLKSIKFMNTMKGSVNSRGRSGLRSSLGTHNLSKLPIIQLRKYSVGEGKKQDEGFQEARNLFSRRPVIQEPIKLVKQQS